MDPAKPRILFLITTSDWGGAQFFVYETAKELHRRGIPVMVAAGEELKLAERCRATGIPYRHLKTLRRAISPFHDLAALHEIRRVIRDFTPTAVHLNSSKMSVLGSIAAAMEKVPRIVYRIGGWSFLEKISTVSRALYLLAEKWTARKKDIIVTVHPGDEEIAKRHGILPRHRLVTIPNGIDLARFDRELLPREEARRRLNLNSDDSVVGTIANFYRPKNLPWYLESISSFAIPHSTFVILGDGPEREMIEKKHHDLNLGDRVILAGRRDDAATLLSAFDIFVLPSSKEGMPWTLLEAMAAGLPCIAMDVGACRWMLAPDAGIIIPPNDAKALQNAISSLENDKTKRAELGLNARRAVESRFRWETTLEETLKLFELPPRS